MKTMIVSLVVLELCASTVRADKKLDEAVAKADEQVLKGRPEEAVKTMQRAAAQRSGSEGQVALGNLQARLGNFEEAGAAFAKASQLTSGEAPPTKASTLAAIASYNLAAGTVAEALQAAQAAVGAQPTSAALAVLARAQVRANDGPSALTTADRAIAAGATDATAHEAKGVVLAYMGLVNDSLAAFRKAVELDPTLTRARAGLALLLASSGKGAEAVAEARRASENDPKSGEAYASLGAAILAENPQSWGEAIAQAQQGAFLNPRSPVVQYVVGKIFESNANLDQAVSAYKKALETDPGYSPARLALVNVRVLQGDNKTVLAEAQVLAKEMPNNGEAHFLLGRALMRASNYAEALPELERAAALSPGLAEALALYATAAFFNDKHDLAVSAYKKALDLKPDNAQWRTDYGLFLARAGSHEAAVVELKRVVEAPGYKDAAGFVNLGYVYRTMTPARFEPSIAAYKKALELDPKEEQAALGLASVYLASQKYDDSIASYERAMQIEPKLAGDAYGGIAWSHFFKKDMPKAREFAAKAKDAGRSATGVLQQVAAYEKALVSGAADQERAMAEAKKAQASAAASTALQENLRSRNPGARMRAVRDLAVAGGPDAVNALVWVLTNDKDWGVKQVAAASLGSMGAAAKPGIPYLKECAKLCPEGGIVRSKEELEQDMLCEDTRRTCQQALSRLPR
jgi:tetratricopeptide (TPR) repeat protein